MPSDRACSNITFPVRLEAKNVAPEIETKANNRIRIRSRAFARSNLVERGFRALVVGDYGRGIGLMFVSLVLASGEGLST